MKLSRSGRSVPASSDRIAGGPAVDELPERPDRRCEITVPEGAGEPVVQGLLGAPDLLRGCRSARCERQLDRSAIIGAIAAPEQPRVHEARDEPARTPALADEPVADLTDRQRVVGVPQDGEHLALRRREAGWAQQLGERAGAFALRAEDEIAELLDRFHGGGHYMTCH